jgi:hypothetical protein
MKLEQTANATMQQQKSSNQAKKDAIASVDWSLD